ncbi:MAG: nuclear transport factor 2 family protein [Acidimicrobiales bacterium]
MTTEANRRIITEMFERWSSGDMRAFSEALADDVSLTTVGSTKYSGTFVGKDQVIASFTPFRELFDEPVLLTAETIVADGDLVAVEARGRSRTKNGLDYCNVYAVFLRMSDGKIVLWTEYFDTELTNTVFGKVDAKESRGDASA